MGTYFRVTYVTDDEIDSSAIYQKINQRLEQINALMSTYIGDSELSRFNDSVAQDDIALSPETFYVIKTAYEVFQQTKGAFDPTIGPLINLWSFGEQARPAQIPTDNDLQTALNHSGFNQVVLREETKSVKKTNPQLKINLSAIAKGYAVDQIALLLDNANIQNYLVDIGGELKAKGKNERAQFWTIAVEKPESGSIGTVQQLVQLDNISIATSGSYRNYFEQNGKRYSHIINPITGHPISHKLVSVSVLHPENMFADAYATALMVMGDENGYQFALQNALPVYMIVKKGDEYMVRTTPQMNNFLID